MTGAKYIISIIIDSILPYLEKSDNNSPSFKTFMFSCLFFHHSTDCNIKRAGHKIVLDSLHKQYIADSSPLESATHHISNITKYLTNILRYSSIILINFLSKFLNMYLIISFLMPTTIFYIFFLFFAVCLPYHSVEYHFHLLDFFYFILASI